MEKDTLENWEKELDFIVTDASAEDLKKIYTEREAVRLKSKLLNRAGDTAFGVDHEDRIKFLKANGYKVNRKNMYDPSLNWKEK